MSDSLFCVVFGAENVLQLTPAFDCNSDSNVCNAGVSSSSAVECDSQDTLQRITFNYLSNFGYKLPRMTRLPRPVLSNLLTVDLSYNSYTGSIPPSFITLSQVQGLSLGWNILTGTIPSYFGLFTNIGSGDVTQSINGWLFLGGNRLTGTLPPEIGNLPFVTQFNVFFNSLTGTIPDSYGNMFSLTQLYLNFNYLLGTLPSSFSQLTEISQLYLSGNYLSGAIPEIFANYAFATEIFLQSNRFTGTIPTSLYGAKSLVSLDLSYNSLSGSIPSVLCSLPLTQLHVEGNEQLTCYSSCLSSMLNSDASVDFSYLPVCSESPTSSPSTSSPSYSQSPSTSSPSSSRPTVITHFPSSQTPSSSSPSSGQPTASTHTPTLQSRSPSSSSPSTGAPSFSPTSNSTTGIISILNLLFYIVLSRFDLSIVTFQFQIHYFVVSLVLTT